MSQEIKLEILEENSEGIKLNRTPSIKEVEQFKLSGKKWFIDSLYGKIKGVVDNRAELPVSENISFPIPPHLKDEFYRDRKDPSRIKRLLIRNYQKQLNGFLATRDFPEFSIYSDKVQAKKITPRVDPWTKVRV